VALDLDLTDATMAMWGVASLGGRDLDAEGRHPRRDFTLSASLEEAGETGDPDETGETGDTDAQEEPPPEEEKVACGCTTSAPPTWAWLLVAGLAALRRR
jgi:uncharacterized protein (TIGR03382 family)